MEDQAELYGLLVEFETPEELLEATRRVYRAGYRRMDAYSPFPVEGLSEALGMRHTTLPLFILAAGIAGAVGGFLMQWAATVIFYPLNAGGRPLNSWPTYIPITFELTVLSAGFAALLGMIIFNGLPQPYHPVFNVAEFARASRDRFFLGLEASDPKFELEETRRFLQGLQPLSITTISKE